MYMKIKDNVVISILGSVYGTKHLTIADIPIVSFTLDGNTAGVVYLIGYIIEKNVTNIIIIIVSIKK